MGARLELPSVDDDLEVHGLAQENLLIDGALPYVGALRARLREVYVFRPYREHHLVARGEAVAVRAQIAELAAHPVEARLAVGAVHGRRDEVRAADEVGDERRGRPLVHLARRADLLDAPAVH